MMSITLDDVELAIKIINQWLRQSRKAEATVRRLMVLEERGAKMPMNMQGFMDMAFRQVTERQGKVAPQTSETQSQEEPDITPEELEEYRRIRDKMKANR
jgi:hypothetical protein